MGFLGRFVRPVVFAAVLAGGAGAALAQTETTQRERFNVGAWDGGAYYLASGAFSHCTIAANYNSGIRVIFYLSEASFLVRLSHGEWRLNAGQTYPVNYWVDNGPRMNANAVAMQTGNSVEIPVGNNEAIFQAFRLGARLFVETVERVFTFRLDGTAVGLDRLRACTLQHSQIAGGRDPRQGGNPFGRDPNPFDGGRNNPGAGGTKPGNAGQQPGEPPGAGARQYY